MPDIVLVTGSTGTIGSEVVRGLTERGAQVRAAVHRRGKDGPVRGGIETVEFDWSRPETWSPALTGAQRVFMGSPLSDQQTVREAAFVEAAREAGVRHVVKLSMMGADADPGTTLGRWHREGERRLEESGMAWTHIRPGLYMSNFLLYYPPRPDGNIDLPWGTAAVAPVAPGDVGDVAAVALTSDTSAGKVWTPTGGRPLTTSEIAEQIASVTGRHIRYVDVLEDAARQAMSSAGMPDWLVAVMLDLHAFVRSGHFAAVTSDVRAATGHEPRPFDDFAREHARHPAWAARTVVHGRSS